MRISFQFISLFTVLTGSFITFISALEAGIDAFDSSIVSSLGTFLSSKCLFIKVSMISVWLAKILSLCLAKRFSIISVNHFSFSHALISSFLLNFDHWSHFLVTFISTEYIQKKRYKSYKWKSFLNLY